MTVLGLAFSVGASAALVPHQPASAAGDKAKVVGAIAPSLTRQSDLDVEAAATAEEAVTEAIASETMVVETAADRPVATEVAAPSRPSAAAVPMPASSARAIAVKHVVREGETLWNLAQLYQVSPGDIARNNGVDADSLRVGQTIEILTTAHRRQISKQTPRAVAEPRSTAKASRNLAQIQVQQAATAVGASVEAAAALRDFQKEEALLASPEISKALTAQKDKVDVGQSNAPSLVVPGAVETEALQAEGQREQLIADASVVSALPTAHGIGAIGASTHTIGLGETVSSIAQTYGLSTRELIELNGLRDPNRIFVGQTLKVPAAPQPAAASLPQIPDEPVQLAAARPVSIPTAEASRFPAAVRNSAEPAVQPEALLEQPTPSSDQATAISAAESLAPSVDEPVNSASAEREAAIAASNPYAEDLISDIEEIAEDGEIEATSDEAPRALAAQDAPATLNEPTSTALDSTVSDQVNDSVNPEFVASRQLGSAPSTRTAVQTSTSEAVSQPEAANEPEAVEPEALVAAAPLGSANYAPLAEPVTGRMVSPELPPLSDPENHLPDASMPFNGYLWPAQGLLTSGYGWRWGRMHKGIDVAAPVGTPIVAAAPGVIEFSGWNSGGYGNMVDIRHPDGNKTRYAHNSRNLVRVGQKVRQGEQIAEMGSTGYSTGPHVHFELHLPDQGAINPVAMLSGQ